MNKIIGIMGLAGAGKDTAALGILEEHDVVIERLAAPLKRAAEEVFGPRFDDRDMKEVDVSTEGRAFQAKLTSAAWGLFIELGFSQPELHRAWGLEQDVRARSQLSPRTYQQLMGTEVCRTVRQNCFVERIQNTQHYKPVVVVDTRFENELQDHNLFVIRPGLWTADCPAHPSEELAWRIERRWQTRDPAPKVSYHTTGSGPHRLHPLFNTNTVPGFKKEAALMFEYVLSL